MKQYKIIRATKHELVGVIFEYVILKGMGAPKWFTEFVEKQFKPLVREVVEIKKQLNEHSEILKRHGGILESHSKILKKHGEILERHSTILEKHSAIFERNNLH